MAKIRQTENYVYYFCPGCKREHSVPPERWNWNGSIDSPTLSPSVLHFYTRPSGERVTTCHYFVRDGKIEFCSDSKHELAGQTVELPDIEESNTETP